MRVDGFGSIPMFTGSYVPQMYMTHNEQNMFLCPVPRFNGLLTDIK